MSPVKSQMGSRSFTRALALALNEWLLMLLLFVNSLFSYMITRFADCSELQSPCMMCSRLDHILGNKLHLKKSHWDMICSKHKSEISSLVYCHAHGKLIDVHGMCETCLKSNAETYRLFAGKLNVDPCSGSKSDSRYCSCCNQLWIPQTAVAKLEMLPKIGIVRTGKQSTIKKSVSFNHLPHVGYTELKFHSDTESEAVFSEDEGHKFRTVDLETPPVITLPYDMATDKLLNLNFPLVTQNDRPELHLKDIGLRANSLYPELIPVNGFPETSDMVFKEEEIISLDDLFLTSRSMEQFAAVSKQKEDSIHFQDSTLPPDFKENPANGSFLMETELFSLENVTSTSDTAQNPEDAFKGIEVVSLNDSSLEEVPESFTTNETFLEMSKENPAETELISFDDVTSTSNAVETHEDVSKEIDLMSFHDTSLEEVPKPLTTIETTVEKSKENPADSSLMETEIISLNDVTSTSDATDTHEDVSKGIDLMSLHNISLEEVSESLTTIETPVEKSKENPSESSLVEETELISFNDVTSAPDDTETHEDVSKGIDLISLHDISQEEVPKSLTTIETSGEKSKENPADSSLMQETELISLSDVTSVSNATETHEDVSKGIDLMSLHDISLDEVSESLTTIETTVEKSKENPSESSLVEETELICFNDVTSTSDAAETHEDVSKGSDLMPLHDISLDEVPTLLTTIEIPVEKSKENPSESSLIEETELISLNVVTSTSDAAEAHEDLSKGIGLMSLHDISLHEVPESLTTIETTVEKKENPVDSSLMEETVLINLNNVTSTSYAAETHEVVSKGIDLMSLHDISQDKVPKPLTTYETTCEKSKENPADSSLMEEPELISFKDATSTVETHEEVSESLTTIKTPLEKSKEGATNQVDIACLESEYIFVSSSKSTKSTPEMSTKKCLEESNELALESDSCSFNSMSVAAETNQYSGELLDLADAYNIIAYNESNKDSNGGEQIEQWMKKDTSRVSEDLKTLLTQISASRGIEFLSPREISPKISDQETENLDYDMQLLLQRKMLERNESNLSLEGVAVSEIEGESESDRLRRQVDHDRKLLTGLYKELEEERSASAIATNQAMAMITRLQEEKAMFQMEALQNMRMMEEQSEYDMEAIQRLNDLLVEREKVIQDLEAEIEYFRDQTP